VVFTQTPKTLLVFLGYRIQESVPVAVVGVWHRQVARQVIKQRRDISRALNGSMSTQRHDAGAWAAHVAHQQLQDGRGANELRAQGVLRKAQSISKDCSALRI